MVEWIFIARTYEVHEAEGNVYALRLPHSIANKKGPVRGCDATEAKGGA